MRLFFYSLLAAISTALLAQVSWESFLQYRLRRRLRQGPTESESKSLIDSTFRPIFSRYTALFKGLKLENHRKKLHSRLVQANLTHKFNEETFWAFQAFMALLFFVGYYAFMAYWALFFSSGPRFLYALAVAVVGFFYPHLWLYSHIKRRMKLIIRRFPEFVSTLSLSVEAGLDYFAAIVRYVENARPGPLSEELAKFISEVRLGNSREEALKNMSSRLKIQAVGNFIAVMIQSTNLGTSISQTLKVQAEKLRRDRFEAAERAGAVASQKILFPLVFFIMPAVFLLIFGPLLVRLMTGGLNALF